MEKEFQAVDGQAEGRAAAAVDQGGEQSVSGGAAVPDRAGLPRRLLRLERRAGVGARASRCRADGEDSRDPRGLRWAVRRAARARRAAGPGRGRGSKARGAIDEGRGSPRSPPAALGAHDDAGADTARDPRSRARGLHGPRARRAVGRGHHLHPDVGRLVVLGHGARRLLATRDRVRLGRAHARVARVRGVDHGRGDPRRPCRGRDLPLRPGQYTSAEFRALCAAHGVQQSMGKTGVCWDNALAESFFATYKLELIELRSWPTRARTRTATVHWIEAVYNRQRRHSAIDMLSPVDYENKFWNRRAAA